MSIVLNSGRNCIGTLQRIGIYSGSTVSFHSRKSHTAGVIVIGDEVLKGQVQDTNTIYLSKELYNRGYSLKTVQVVSDDVNVLSDVMKWFSEHHDIVLTTGGIGPTHDDVTYEALALAFNDKLHYHPEIVKMCKDFFKTNDENHPGMKLACVPITAKLTYGIDKKTGVRGPYPNISLKNVFIFPGVPYLCKRMFKLICDELFPSVGKFYNQELYLDVNESEVVIPLNEAVKLYPNVLFGSYPEFFHSYFTVKISLESLDNAELEEAANFLKNNLKGFVLYDSQCFSEKSRKLEKVENVKVREMVESLKNVLKENNPDDLYLYFDGGKNSTLLLHILSILYDELDKKPLNVIHVDVSGKPPIKAYTELCCKNYNLNFIKLNEINFKRFILSDKNIILIKGTRNTDPKFKETSNYFSQFNTFNPISNWSYGDIWGVIRSLSLPYCKLYDQGFSSLSQGVNSHLIVDGPRNDIVYYKSAHLLENPDHE